MRAHFFPALLVFVILHLSALPAAAQTQEQKVAADAFLTALIARSWEQVEAFAGQRPEAQVELP
ncbi:MAG: hypothetical protein RRA94_11985, partial [Bacteroidota bacterium]|nr:hypothetical protein [Bacteroidota bacterium]